MKAETLIIDGPYLSHRSHDAPYAIFRKDGMKVTHIHSFIQTIHKLRQQFKPSQTIVTWESHGTTSWRRQLFPEYKPSQSVPKHFIQQQEDLKKMLHLLSVHQFSSAHNEADDVIACLVKECKTQNTTPVVIYSTDKDLMQLVDDSKQVKQYTGKQLVGEKEVKTKFNVPPKYISDLLAIAGDASDNIPGVPSYGPKKASELINKYGRIENFPPEIVAKISHAPIFTNKKLTKLNENCKLDRYVNPDEKATLEQLFDKYELPSLKRRISEFLNISEVKSLSEFM